MNQKIVKSVKIDAAGPTTEILMSLGIWPVFIQLFTDVVIYVQAYMLECLGII